MSTPEVLSSVVAEAQHLLAQDAANRSRALDMESFIVEAPAGAGKTELLTQRYLRLLATVDEPEEIVAITFTNKAAAEMRERIQSALGKARSGEVPVEAHKRLTFDLATAALARDAECDWQLERQPARLRLTTIDAFCVSLARQMPLLSRFGVQPALADDVRRHYEEAARRTLSQLDDEQGPGSAPLATVLAYLDNDTGRFLRLLADMLARREQWSVLWRAGMDHPESEIHQSLLSMVELQMARLGAALDARWQAEVMPLARYVADNLGGTPLSDWCSPLPAQHEALPQWRALAGFLLTEKGDARKTVTVKNGFPPHDKQRKEDMLALLEGLSATQVAALRRLRELPEAAPDDDEIVRALVMVLKLASAELWLVFRERGEVDFSELSMRAVAALQEAVTDGEDGQPSELALRLDYRLRHLLVDEFQDTSPAQIDLLASLTAGWQAGDGRTLFAVGDPMQSIYRFRKADVGLFLQVARHGIGGLRLEPLRLSRNNRSDPAVVDWINQTFPTVFPASDEPVAGEISYRPFVATRVDNSLSGVQVHPLCFADPQAMQHRHRIEAQRIVDILAEEWRQDPKRTVAVLVRAREHLRELVAALRQHPAGWRFAAVDVEPLVGRQVVQDLISLTHALRHRGDRLHWLAILRAPWCGLRLADLHALAADDHQSTIWALMNDAPRLERLSADGRDRLLHVRSVMAEALAGDGRQRLSRWIEDAWRKLGGPGVVSATELADARAFFDRVEWLEASGRFALDTLESDMSKLFAKADTAADGRLQLMTIHKSKGLEFDTVIVPGLQRVQSADDAPLLIWDSFPLPEGERLVAAPINRRRDRGATPSAYDFIRDIERQRSRNEDARVLYVAATRAIGRLHLLGTALVNEQGQIKEPRSTSFLYRLWPAVEPLFAVQQCIEATVGEGADPGAFAPALVRRRDMQPALADAVPVKPTAMPVFEETGDRFSAAIGTLVHACLEQMVTPHRIWDAGELQRMEPNLVRWLSTRGWPQRQATEGARSALTMLRVTLTSDAGRWVLGAQEDEGAELVIAQSAESTSALAEAGDEAPYGLDDVRVRVVDRCFIADNVRWIIDYKTTQFGQAPTDAQFFAHAQRYREQLAGYARLFATEARLVRCAILYVAYGKLIRFD